MTNDMSGHYWTVKERRELFEDFAKSKGFDPTIISNWYSVRREEILPFKVCVVLYACIFK